MKSNVINIILLYIVFICILFSSCSAKANNNIVIQFDDGSKILGQGGITYYHCLFDDYVISFSDKYFSGQLKLNTKKLSTEVKELSTKVGYYIRYAFDPNGYIAYYRLVESEKPNDNVLCQRQYGETIANITEENAILYICKEDTELYFNTTADLFTYCEEKNIELGQWYYGNNIGNPTEEIIASCNNWQIVKRPWDSYIIRYEKNDMFTGDIDKYSINENYLTFHIQIVENKNYRGDENPIISYSTDVISGQKFKGLYLGFSDIYVDNYIIIDINTNEYKIYESKEAVKKAAVEFGFDLNWTKI